MVTAMTWAGVLLVIGTLGYLFFRYWLRHLDDVGRWMGKNHWRNVSGEETKHDWLE
jgi:hypothetical protein